jgi:predicted RNA-binding protein with PIN domain
MRYLIDGYNLLHAMGLLRTAGPAGPHGLEKARLGLLGHVRGGHGAGAPAVTVVFDARGAPPGADAEDDYQGVHVRYALHGEADDLIEELVRHDSAPRRLTVVSDDHRVQEAARRRHCVVLGCMDYLDHLERLRRVPPTPSADGPAKPDGVSAAEVERWLAEFGGLEDDPELRGGFGEGDGL